MRRTLLLVAAFACAFLPAVPASAEVRAEFALGILTVTGDGDGNTIVVACEGGDVRVNGDPPSGGQVRCDEVQAILVRARAGGDRVVLSDVGRSSFAILLEIGLFGEEGNDTIIGSELNDRIDGGGGIDDLRGGAGADRLLPGGGGGSIVGGGGKDTVLVEGGGMWTANDRRLSHGGEKTTLRGVESLSIDGWEAGDTIVTKAFAGAVVIDGGGGNDVIRSGPGRDRLLGSGGDDLLHGGPDRDVLEGGDGDDELRGGQGKDQLRGGLGDDGCRGGPGADSELSC
jgi:Ca2+-binding RTX toxin-like protein